MSFWFLSDAQEIREKYIYFPKSSERKFTSSLGMLFTTTQRDITEEYQFRIPAIDFHLTQKLYKGFYFISRLNSQILQNHLTAGLRWNKNLSERTCIGIGDDFGYWAGFIKLEGFNTHGNGWVNYPNFSVGRKFGQDVLITLKGEVLLDLSYHTYVGNIDVTSHRKFYNGEAISLFIEQPFYHQSWFVLGFRALYSNYFWQTWSVFETFDRNTFYPQLVFGFVL